ncbi:hypothetical protein RJT34_30521 [Clitoria ternatea]|uniref:RRM domain-containing protein n=1 Tax=Clitoria ternatea TaxID=43366 RepID=A0AAN9ETM0_CLITE
MRTRNADSSSKSATPKKTPTPRKSAPAKRTPATKSRSNKNKELSPASDSNPDQTPPEQKSVGNASTRKSAKKRTPGRPRVKAIGTPNLEERCEAVVDDAPIEETVEKADEPEDIEAMNGDNVEGEKEREQGVGLSDEMEKKSMEVDEPVVETEKGKKNIMDVEVTASQDASDSFKQQGCAAVDLNISAENDDCVGEKEGEEDLSKQVGGGGKEELKEMEGEKELKEQEVEKGKEELEDQEIEKGKEELKEEVVEKEREGLKEREGEKGEENVKEPEGEKGKEDVKEQEEQKGKGELKEEEGDKGKEELKEKEPERAKGENTSPFGHDEKAQLQKEDADPKNVDSEGLKSGEKLGLGEKGRKELVEEDPEEDPEEPPKENVALEEEHMELEAIAKQRKIKKEHEIFVGGLDRDATEDDLRKVFQRIGEIVEVRLHKNSSTNKNKGYAFVKFANKEHAKKALSEMKNPVICGKRCGTAPSEDNDTLFLGNICNSWTKEAIKQKLKDYGVEGVENITLVPDVQHVGLSRGFAFLEFSCHADAMLAYKRLQKPDVIFGHAERTAKVAFAEPIHEPNPEIMAQVKSVFINGLPPHWEEDHVRDLLKSYGEIVRIVLARNMSTAKRKDYGFVDFSTHDAALACVEGVNKSELGDGTSKIKVRARLSNPLPKTQAVKGGMCGGFRIGHARSGASSRPGRGFGRGRQPFNNWGNFNRERSFHRGGHSQIGRAGFRDDRDFNMYPDFNQRQFGPQGAVRGGHYAGGRGAAFAGPSRPYYDRAWYSVPDGGRSEPVPLRRPYSPGGQFDMPSMGRGFDDPYVYDDNMHGIKRPFYMTDPEPDYMGPNRLRPRLDYADPPIFHGTPHHGHDSFGAGSRHYPPDYYGSDYGRAPYSSYYGGDGSHGHGYYY